VAVWLAVAIVVLMMADRWRMRVQRRVQSDLMRLVRERTEQLEEANRKLALLSYRDAITEVANRRSFDEALAMEWRRSTRSRADLSLLMVDIDGFKAYNDGLGHLEGDRCLRTVAGVITECVHRAGDTVARYGGEEFAVILSDTGTAGASVLAERIRKAVEARNIRHDAVPGGRLTVSVGVATKTDNDPSEPSMLVRAADAALYDAKRAGRNTVRIAEAANAERRGA
jgi:diguanylate cyclase (GGDEF)-like protein